MSLFFATIFKFKTSLMLFLIFQSRGFGKILQACFLSALKHCLTGAICAVQTVSLLHC